MKLPAGGIEGALEGLFRFQGIDKRTTLIIDPVVKNSLDAAGWARLEPMLLLS